jgi:hypothetical protein
MTCFAYKTTNSLATKSHDELKDNSIVSCALQTHYVVVVESYQIYWTGSVKHAYICYLRWSQGGLSMGHVISSSRSGRRLAWSSIDYSSGAPHHKCKPLAAYNCQGVRRAIYIRVSYTFHRPWRSTCIIRLLSTSINDQGGSVNKWINVESKVG